ncbi:hypothetical protein GCM10011575_33200 [Microlunatus endophyticus]|uniref:DUF5941 domain-containing protein n=1 Tax=Microlunatus endophyticus TaxID=1716077 RepID=A0A917W717_9ACTN|nr:CDP-alcohol phosphatidyltransferase family protein [Microlunatus endophyticus]GGL72150.1 hypothetical protein GCM10011575_33200 [Microlunatus endophyticus]
MSDSSGSSDSQARPAPGNAAARAVRGYGAGAQCVATGAIGTELETALGQVCAGAAVHQVADLAQLAERAEDGHGPLVVIAGGLDLGLPATLDLLDSRGDRTAVLLADPRNIEAPRQHAYGLERATLARVAADRTVESIGTAAHQAGNPNRVVVGLLRIREADRCRAAELWRSAAAEGSAAEGSAADSEDPFDLALLALVRGGLAVVGQPLGYYRWSRDRNGDGRGVGQDGLGATGWGQRLRSASRLGDGAYSAAVVRRLSRLGTWLALRTRVTPNQITAISLAIGILAGLLIFTGRPAAWIAAAVLLQLSLIIDCMDGEVARFTRRYSDFGGWLDGIGDRVKEYLAFAAVAVVAVRDHHHYGWLLAAIAMVVVTARHLEDYAYTDRQAPGRVGRPALVPLSLAGDGSADGAPTTLRPQPSRPARIAFWVRKIAHVPIAERYLVLSLALLTLRPLWVLVAAIAVSGFALVWTVGGRLLRALRPAGPYATPSLAQQLDLGLLAGLAGRVRVGFLPGLLALIISWLGLIASIGLDSPAIAWAWAVVSVVIVGCVLRTPVTHRLGWLALPLVWIGESAVIGSLLVRGIDGSLIFVALAAIAYRRYELIYSIRIKGVPGPRSLLGADGRILVVGVLFSLAQLTGTPGVITWGLLAVALETLAEAVLATAIRWRRPGGPTAGEEDWGA